ncbi:MAG: hypothetical protein JXM79_18490 [Sedimentisphaerales bacterium]|nr:hypothetical protein [Sedimentisphaerales bacterium]
MARMRRLLSVCFVCMIVQGCASGPSYQQIEKEMPTLSTERGRIFFVQSSEYSDSGGGHEVKLNGFYIGKSMPGGFFYVDRSAGKHSVHCASESLTFALKAGETKYIELVPTLYGDNPSGVRIIPIDSREGQRMLSTLTYAGGAYRAG